MIPLWVVMWLPVAVTGAFGVLLVGAWLRGTGRGGADDTDGESEGGDSGPIDWPEFERQFAEFAARRPRPAAVSRERGSEEVGAG